MLIDIIFVEPLENYQLMLGFEDGSKGVVDIRQIVPFQGVFKRLEEEIYFRQVSVSPDLGTICWPNGADLDTDVLYGIVTGELLPELEEIVKE